MGRRAKAPKKATIGFALGGGGLLGAYEVGMLRALIERDIRPDLVVGTSVGALNGVAVAVAPTAGSVDKLEELWRGVVASEVFSGSVARQAATLARSRTHLHPNRPLAQLLDRYLPATRFEDLAVPFQCVAASIERAAEHWFSEGPLVPAILASTAVPGLLPPVEIGGEHFVDGGIVNSIPIDRAVELGATTVFVLHVGRIEKPLDAPRNLWQVATVAFELARRHRFARSLAQLPEGVTAHVLPTGEERGKYDARAQLRYRDASQIGQRIERARVATAGYLDEVWPGS